MLSLENVSFSYNKKHLNLFNNLSLNISQNGVYGILGKNGMGKTTLLKLIVGLLRPLSGTLSVDKFTSFPRNFNFLSNLFFIPEEAELPRVTLSSYCNVLSKFYQNFDEELFLSYLREFELSEDLNLAKASFGQKKKAILSLAFASNVKVLVLDEPTNGLDIPSKAKLREIVKKNKNKIILISGHNIRDLNDILSHIIILNKGELLFNNSLSYILENYKITAAKTLNGDELYWEGEEGNFKVLVKGKSEGDFDLEFLFLAVLSSRWGLYE